jgi:hypothetical protein
MTRRSVCALGTALRGPFTGRGGGLRFCEALRFRRLCLDRFSTLIFPKLTKSLGRKFRVPDGVLDSAVAQVMLNRASIHALVGQVKPTGMTKHVGMDGEG